MIDVFTQRGFAVECGEVAGPNTGKPTRWWRMVEWIQMEEALDESDVRLFSRGDTVRGRVVQEAGQDILVDIGYKSEAILPKRELAPHHEVAQSGEEIEVLITYIDEEN
ncbi:MAG: S1 RNA-binding domain-containing protein, partial [Candidatus Bipolaricaulis anaerobius]|nr:S1 RNA-binding domain-containing protein [Candidatus Bipolaricaulis anaerobius]